MKITIAQKINEMWKVERLAWNRCEQDTLLEIKSDGMVNYECEDCRSRSVVALKFNVIVRWSKEDEDLVS